MTAEHALRLVRHRNPRAFAKSAAPLFVRNPAAYSGMVASAQGMDGKAAAASSLLTVHGANGTEGVALRREQGVVAIGDSSAHAADLVARALAADGVQLAGVVGSLDACEAFARAWREATGNVHALRFHLRNYALGQLRDVRSAAGHARAAEAADAKLCCDWLADFRVEARVPDDPARVRTITRERIAAGGVWLWVDGHARALLGFVRPTRTMARIVSVYAPPAGARPRLCAIARRRRGRDAARRRMRRHLSCRGRRESREQPALPWAGIRRRRRAVPVRPRSRAAARAVR